jgi:AraC-like DNA-binding protein
MATHNQNGSNADDALARLQSEMAATVERLTRVDGMYPTAIPGLTLFRLSSPPQAVYCTQEPSFCLVAQGSKEIIAGGEQYLYDPSHYLIASLDLPIIGRMRQVSPDRPYLGARFDLAPGRLSALLTETDIAEKRDRRLDAANPERSLCVSRLDAPLLDAVVRLLRLLDHPQDISALAPLAEREILYRLFMGEQGARLRQMARDNSVTQRIAQTIDWLKHHYAEPLQIEALARTVSMSASGLHHHFKAATAMSPLQYQKQLRLQESRRLMLCDDLDAATAGYRVGYESPSQFSREYSRLFGAPPARDIARLRR